MTGNTPRTYDIVLYGATGFVGRQTVAYMAAHAGGLRWALAGRNRAALERTRAMCGAGAANAGIIVADAMDDAALGVLARDTRVVLNTAGPFALYGNGLVAACVSARTDYVDITGESPWVHALIERHHTQAAVQGTRIVPGCGFDSVPSDLGAWLVATHIRRTLGEPCASVKSAFTIRGSFNGGTLATAFSAFESGDMRRGTDLFLLNPRGTLPSNAAAQRNPMAPRYDRDFHAWVAPFLMGQVNSQVVRRTAGLLSNAAETLYAPSFAYTEFQRFGRGVLAPVLASTFTAALGISAVVLSVRPLRRLAQRLVPAPGQGPSEATMDNGFLRCDLIGRSRSGRQVRGRIVERGDPGNRATVKMVCESALALVHDADALPGAPGLGGVLTPATALGEVLAKRLREAGMSIEVPATS